MDRTMELSSIPELEKSIQLLKDDLSEVEKDIKLTIDRSNEISKRIETQDYEDIDGLNQLQSVNERLLKKYNELSLNRVLCQRKNHSWMLIISFQRDFIVNLLIK